MLEHKYVVTGKLNGEVLRNIRWHWIEAPTLKPIAGLPLSRHEHGVIAADRYILDRDLEAAGLKR